MKKVPALAAEPLGEKKAADIETFLNDYMSDEHDQSQANIIEAIVGNFHRTITKDQAIDALKALEESGDIRQSRRGRWIKTKHAA